jgi:hypothetical protein
VLASAERFRWSTKIAITSVYLIAEPSPRSVEFSARGEPRMLFIERISRPSKPSIYASSAARPKPRVFSSVLKKTAVGSVV